MSAYEEIFTEEFDAHITKVTVQISDFLDALKLEAQASYLEKRINLANLFFDYVKYIPQIREDVIRQILIAIRELQKTEKSYKDAVATWLRDAENEMENKKNNFGKSLTPITLPETVTSFATLLSGKLTTIDNIMSPLIKIVAETKLKASALTPIQIIEKLQNLEKRRVQREYKKTRIQQNAQCAQFKEQYDAIEVEKKAIDQAIEKLESEQSNYLDEYFDKLNHWFNRLGSDGFTIEKITGNQGHKKVYSLRVKYNDQPIVNLDTIFSESDKRNLALSLFMARIDQENDKCNKIIVFDDPVVSFDDNRIVQTCNDLKTIAPEYRQVIVLTHYGSVLRHMYRSKTAATYIEIVQRSRESQLNEMDARLFSMSEREKEYEKIQRFIEGEYQDSVLKLLRPFLEGSVKDRFRKQLNDAEKYDSSFSNIIDYLRDEKHIEESLSAELKNIKDSLNPEHHDSSEEENIENTKTQARRIMDIVYGELC